MKPLHYLAAFLIVPSAFAQSAKVHLVPCNQSSTCSHSYQNGRYFQTIADAGRLVSLAAVDTGKYFRIDITATNQQTKPFDVVPGLITARASEPKEKILKLQPVYKMERNLEGRAAWSNGFAALGAGMARQQITTETTTSGTVNAYSTNGTSAHGNYNGTSTSTISVPDYAAQARASQQIEANRQTVASQERYLEQVALRASTLTRGQTISGALFFDRVKKGVAEIQVPIDDTVYLFRVELHK